MLKLHVQKEKHAEILLEVLNVHVLLAPWKMIKRNAKVQYRASYVVFTLCFLEWLFSLTFIFLFACTVIDITKPPVVPIPTDPPNLDIGKDDSVNVTLRISKDEVSVTTTAVYTHRFS